MARLERLSAARIAPQVPAVYRPVWARPRRGDSEDRTFVSPRRQWSFALCRHQSVLQALSDAGSAGLTEGDTYAEGKVVKVPTERIRNFSIIAHIDHGKSTLADQLLLKTQTVSDREMQAQFMDTNEIERERGITIKLNTARMKYTAADGELYALNLIDTPGHVDFGYEVSRSLAACEGALLVVDAAQGVEAQTLANVYLALENNLEIVVVLNKIDLPGADPERVKAEIEEVVGLDTSDALLVSAKNGIGIEELLEAIVRRIPPPQAASGEQLTALIFDSYYDDYKGVICQFRVKDGEIQTGDRILFMNTQKEFEVDELGVLAPHRIQVDRLFSGEVGYLAASIKQVSDARVGDTITSRRMLAEAPLPGYAEAQPMVYCGLFPVSADQYQALRTSLEKLQLNDAALRFETENSVAMGSGFRCGFLGLLHMEIVQERLEREYDLDLIVTAPTVVYRCITKEKEEVIVSNPVDLPELQDRDAILEPFCRVEIITPKDFVGPVMDLCQSRRGDFVSMQYLNEQRTALEYQIPLAEVVTDFFDALKSRSKGYASMEYAVSDYRKSDLVKLEIKINNEAADPLATIVHKDEAYYVGKELAVKLKELIPRQQFRVPIQAAIGSRIIASAAVPALRKDVLAKCYGGDISRKKKLLKKQAAGKKRMKSIGKVDVPQDAFMAVLQVGKAKEE